MTTSGIYIITNLKSGKIYIGSTNDFERRWKEHRRDLCKGTHWNSHLQNAWNKYGEDAFEFSVLEYLDNSKELVKAEQFWMDIYREEGKELYNHGECADNALRGMPMDEETKRKLSVAMKGKQNHLGHRYRQSKETRRKMSGIHRGNQYALGRKHTEEAKQKIGAFRRGKKLSEATKQKISESLRGRKLSEETRRKIGEAVRARWASLHLAARVDFLKMCGILMYSKG